MKTSTSKKNTLSYESYSSEPNYLRLQIENVLIPYPSFHDSFELIYLIEGQANLILSGTPYLLKSGEACLIRPNQVHFFEMLSNTTRAIIVVMGHSYSHHFRTAYNTPLQTVMRDKVKNERLYEILSKWLFEKENGFLTNCAYANFLFDFLLKSYASVDENTNAEDERLAFQFINYIQNNYQNDISLASTAQYFSYSKEYFCSLFNKLIGQSFLAVLNTTRIQNAIEMINDPQNTKSLEAISVECGFNSMSTFFRHYKQFLKTSSSQNSVLYEHKTTP